MRAARLRFRWLNLRGFTAGTFPAGGLTVGTDVIVCVRQGGVCLNKQGKGALGRVLDTRFLGDVGLVEVAVQGLDTPILARVRENDVPDEGTEVGVSVDEGAVLIFQAENGSGEPSP